MLLSRLRKVLLFVALGTTALLSIGPCELYTPRGSVYIGPGDSYYDDGFIVDVIVDDYDDDDWWDDVEDWWDDVEDVFD